MLTQLEVFTPRVATPTLTFDESGSAEQDPIQILDIQGLGPVAASVATTQYGQIDGEVYNGSVVGKRNIVIEYGFNPDYAGEQSVATLRRAIYAYFMPRNQVTLRFYNSHMADCQIDGIVESVEPNIFSEEPSIQVSILCPYPYFTDLVATTIYGLSTNIGVVGTTVVDYEGTVPSGVVLGLDYYGANMTSGMFNLQVIGATTETLSILSGLEVSSTNKAEFSTVMGDKYARKINRTTLAPTNILGLVAPVSKWPQLYPGTQKISIQTNSPGSQVWDLSYFNRYGGL